MIRERTSAGIAAARAEGRVGGRRKKLDAAKRREIAESVITGRKSGAEMARLYNVSQPTVSRIVAQHRDGQPIAQGRYKIGMSGGRRDASLEKAALKNRRQNLAESRRSRSVAGQACDGELLGGDRRTPR